MLEGVVQRGTAPVLREVGKPVAGMTGTTNDWKDAWFVGYTPDLSTAVWMGSPVGNTVKMLNVGGVARVTGGSFPARIWQAFMGPAHEGRPIEDFPAPPPAERGTYLRLPGERDLRPRSTTTTSTSTTTGPATTRSRWR